MSFTVRIESDLVVSEAGATVPLTLEVANRGDESETFELTVEGLDPDWTAVPDPTFSVDPHDLATAKVFFKPPRVSESVAGTYPFVVKIRSLKSGEARTAQGALEIKPFHHLSVDISPRRATVSPFNREASMQATVMNLGNSEHTVQLFASDPEDSVACEFDTDQVTVGPGAQKAIEFGAISTKRPLFSGPRLFGLSVIARSVSTPTVAGSGQFQLEQRALMSPGALAFVTILVLMIAGWFALIPKSPTVDAFSLDRRELTLGESVTLRWRTSNAQSVEIYKGDSLLDSNPSGAGFLTVQPEDLGDIVYSIRAVGNNKRSEPVGESLHVKPPPIIPEPRIDSFKIEPKLIQLGQPFLVKYQVRNATRITLAPLQIELDPRASERELTANRAGKVEYVLIAENAAGKTVQASVTVTVTEGSQAKINTFTAFPTSLEAEGGFVRITWQVTGAAKAELTIGDQVTQVDPSGGSQEVQISKTTTIVLKVTDEKSKSEEKKVVVTVKELPEGDPTEPSTTGSITPSTTGSSNPPTTGATSGGG